MKPKTHVLFSEHMHSETFLPLAALSEEDQGQSQRLAGEEVHNHHC